MARPQSAPGSKPTLTDSGSAEPRGFSFLRHASPSLTAVLVDAAFFLKRARRIYGSQSPESAARLVHKLALEHLNDDKGRRVSRLYRIFVYDAPPVAWKGHLPISRKPVDYGDSDVARWRPAFHEELKCLRKVALRLGEIPTSHAAKLARREGIDFVLDAMWSTIRPDLYEHIDDMRSVCPKPMAKVKSGRQGGS